MSDNFAISNAAGWTAAITRTFDKIPPQSAHWTDAQVMIGVLTPFMGLNLNHTMLPSRGGQDLESITRSHEPNCLEFSLGDGLAYMFRPADLFFEYFPESPHNSFFLLELQTLPPCGIYEDSDGEYEDVVEISPGKYVDASCRDTGVFHDEGGREIPLPKTFRAVTRYMQGKFLIVAKRSIWNRISETYDGRHNQMTAEQIRKDIQHLIRP